jgi:hypothetical protein
MPKSSDDAKIAALKLGFRNSAEKGPGSRAYSRKALTAPTIPTPQLPPIGLRANPGGRVPGSRDAVGGGLPPRRANKDAGRRS